MKTGKMLLLRVWCWAQQINSSNSSTFNMSNKTTVSLHIWGSDVSSGCTPQAPPWCLEHCLFSLTYTTSHVLFRYPVFFANNLGQARALQQLQYVMDGSFLSSSQTEYMTAEMVVGGL